MFEAVKSGISSASANTIDWVKTPDELVAGIDSSCSSLTSRAMLRHGEALNGPGFVGGSRMSGAIQGDRDQRSLRS
jgi:hypothetical protein